MKNLYCGLDIHKDTITGCIMDKEGNILRHHRFPTRTDSITAFLANISNADMEIALEACGLWRGIYTILHTQGYTTHLANPRKIHDIAGKKKTDKEDAKILADLLRTGYLPTVHIPPEHILKLRDITRHKATLTRLRATIQIKIKSYLRREGTPYNHNIWKKDTLDQIAHQDHNLTNLINLYKKFKKEENEVMGRIRKHSTTLKTPSLLKTIPGIGDYSALLIHAEIGDIKRFPTPKQLTSYAGLCPGN